MAAPEIPDIPGWSQAVIGGCIFLGGIGAMITRFLGAKAEPEVSKSVVLEQAEVADMKAIRDLIEALEPLPDLLKMLPDTLRGIADLRADTARLMARQETTWENQRKLIDFAEKQERARELRDGLREMLERDEIGRHPINRDR